MKPSICPLCEHEFITINDRTITLKHGPTDVYLRGDILYCPVCGNIGIPLGTHEVVDEAGSLDDLNARYGENADNNEKEVKNTEITDNDAEKDKDKESSILSKIKKPGEIKKPKNKMAEYLKTHVPEYKEIRNNVLYDTRTATAIYVETKTGGYGKNTYPFKRYYYQTPTKRFFFIDVVYGKKDDFSIMSEKDLEFALRNNPELYKQFCREYES